VVTPVIGAHVGPGAVDIICIAAVAGKNSGLALENKNNIGGLV